MTLGGCASAAVSSSFSLGADREELESSLELEV